MYISGSGFVTIKSKKTIEEKFRRMEYNVYI